MNDFVGVYDLNSCGNCPMWRKEVCTLFSEKREKDQICKFSSEFLVLDKAQAIKALNKAQAIKVLHWTQKYRRGAESKMPPPKVIGLAIDFAIKELRKKKKNKHKRHEGKGSANRRHRLNRRSSKNH